VASRNQLRGSMATGYCDLTGAARNLEGGYRRTVRTLFPGIAS
jgi:hypothetical protein